MSKFARVSIESVIQAFGYDPDSGLFVWKKRPAEAFATKRAASIYASVSEGKPAFTHIGAQGYCQSRLNGCLLNAHRVAFVLMENSWPAQQVDHINGDRADNRWDNLRLADQAMNSRNMAMPKRNSSGRVGVGYDQSRGKWYAQGRADNRQYNLGRFDTMDQAVAARSQFERDHAFHPNHGRVA